MMATFYMKPTLMPLPHDAPNPSQYYNPNTNPESKTEDQGDIVHQEVGPVRGACYLYGRHKTAEVIES